MVVEEGEGGREELEHLFHLIVNHFSSLDYLDYCCINEIMAGSASSQCSKARVLNLSSLSKHKRCMANHAPNGMPNLWLCHSVILMKMALCFFVEDNVST